MCWGKNEWEIGSLALAAAVCAHYGGIIRYACPFFVRQGQDVHGHGALARAAPCHSSGETVLAPAGGRHIPASKLHHFYESDINDAAANQIIR